jgi:hypothetical protein
MTPSELIRKGPFRLAMPCTPGIVESEGPEWEDYSSIESSKTGEVIVEGIHDDTAPAVLAILNETYQRWARSLLDLVDVKLPPEL